MPRRYAGRCESIAQRREICRRRARN